MKVGEIPDAWLGCFLRFDFPDVEHFVGSIEVPPHGLFKIVHCFSTFTLLESDLAEQRVVVSIIVDDLGARSPYLRRSRSIKNRQSRILSVEAQIGMRMKNLGFGRPLSRKAVHELPRHPAPLSATSNHPQPALANLEPKTPETGEIAGYGVIGSVALHHTPQPFPDFRQRLMHPLPKRGLHLFQLGEESLSDGFAQHEELAVLPGLSAYVREPQEVKRLRFALSPLLSVYGRKPPKLNQAGLVRMKFQLELLQSFPPIL